MMNDFWGASAAFVAMPETRQIAQPKQLSTTNINSRQIYIGKGQHHIEK